MRVEFPEGKIGFVRDRLEVSKRVCGESLLTHAFRMTVAYRVLASEQEDAARDPAFVVQCGLAFWDVFNSDTPYTNAEGRKWAVDHLHEDRLNGLVVRVYVGQTILAAVYAALSKQPSARLRHLHVPQRLNHVFHAMRKRPVVPLCATYKERESIVAKVARGIYNQAIAGGKTRDEAIALCREHFRIVWGDIAALRQQKASACPTEGEVK